MKNDPFRFLLYTAALRPHIVNCTVQLLANIRINHKYRAAAAASMRFRQWLTTRKALI